MVPPMKRVPWLTLCAVAAVLCPLRPPAVRAGDPTPPPPSSPTGPVAPAAPNPGAPTPPPPAPAVPAAPPPSAPAVPAPGGPVVAAPLPAPAAAAGPRIKLDELTHDFGIVRQQQDLTAKIRYTNTGSAPLHLTARGECSCAQVTASKKTLEPGESGELELTFHTYWFSGRITKSVTVTSDDPDHGEVHVKVTADVSAGILLDPQNFFFNAALVGTSPTSTVKVKYKMGVGKPFRITDVRATGTGTADMKFDVRAFFEGDWKGYEVTMKFNEPPPAMSVSGEAFITTDDPEYKSIRLLVGGLISTKVFLAQRKTSIGMPEQGKDVTIKLGCRGFDDTIELGDVSAKSRKGVVSARAVKDPTDPKTWLIEITLPGTTPVGPVSDVVEVTTEVRGEEHLEIEVEGTVVAKAK